MMLPFKVQVGDMEIQPKLICKVVATARNDKSRLYLARQKAMKAIQEGAVNGPDEGFTIDPTPAEDDLKQVTGYQL